jgi:transposase
MKPRKREPYSREFKLEAVRLVKAGKKPVTQLAAELGVARQQLHAWVRLFDRNKGQKPSDVFPGNGNRSEADAEIVRLRKQVAQLEEDKEILKKAAAFFAKESR